MLLFLASLQTAHPCAAMITKNDGSIAMSDAQEVILERTETGVRTRYRVTYDGDAEDFGWFIVVDGDVAEDGITEADESVFDDYRALTTPLTAIRSSSSGSSGCGGIGCSGDKSIGAGEEMEFDGEADLGVDVVAEGFAGPFSYQVLDASNPDDLSTWLDDNDFDLGDSADTIGAYVDDGAYSFVVVTLSPDAAETPEEGRTLPALSIETNSDRMHFPARMAQTGMADFVRTRVWVLGSQVATVTDGWASQEVNQLFQEGDQSAEETYDAHLTKLASRDTPTYAMTATVLLESADSSGGENWVLTAFETLAPRASHTVDPVFDYTDYDYFYDWNTTIVRSESTSESIVWFALPLIGLAWMRRRNP